MCRCQCLQQNEEWWVPDPLSCCLSVSSIFLAMFPWLTAYFVSGFHCVFPKICDVMFLKAKHMFYNCTTWPCSTFTTGLCGAESVIHFFTLLSYLVFEILAMWVFFFLNLSCSSLSDDHGFSPLHWACREGRSNVVDMLIMRGARINVMNRGDDTPLHLAASHGHRDICGKVRSM